MSKACPSCGTKLRFVRYVQSRFDCRTCGAALRANSLRLFFITVGLTVAALFAVYVLPQLIGEVRVAVPVMLVKLLVGIGIYIVLCRRYHTVTLDNKPSP